MQAAALVGTTLSSAEQIKLWSKGETSEYKDKNDSFESYYFP